MYAYGLYILFSVGCPKFGSECPLSWYELVVYVDEPFSLCFLLAEWLWDEASSSQSRTWHNCVYVARSEPSNGFKPLMHYKPLKWTIAFHYLTNNDLCALL
jgi:hypothetical protein